MPNTAPEEHNFVTHLERRPQAVIEVVAGVVINSEGEALVNQRTHPAEFMGKWEFPGGKIEAGETVDQALHRELMEEIHIQTLASEPLISITHEYPNSTVRLHVRKITAYSGKPVGREGQTIKWIDLDDLYGIDFLEANEPILNAVRLPHNYLITNAARFGVGYTLQRLEALLKKTNCIVQVREKEMEKQAFEDFSKRVIKLCHSYGNSVLANAEPEIACALGFDGVHLSSARLKELKTRPGPDRFWVGASCHDRREIETAVRLGVDFGVLSPVRSTGTHPQAEPMGWDQFARLCSDSRIPIYALGGVGFGETDRARTLGAQGVAMIRAAWDPSHT